VMQAGIALVGTESAYEIACNRAITIPIYRAALPVLLREPSRALSRRSSSCSRVFVSALSSALGF
jgi:hypothetical protein